FKFINQCFNGRLSIQADTLFVPVDESPSNRPSTSPAAYSVAFDYEPMNQLQALVANNVSGP
ncbi:hypothetical protein ACOIFA_33060, partial [Klebsiella pneumoniae]|uniref:hypothetical protein n=1 Tax=Klebsiella pneumoniae TaxID=573 RepID=UPI003B597634